ncbi:glycosyltransferase family 4 protein [Intrasporangium chromatireducens]|uniref:glycosyltransferase n=1 Tax=Intrasporangium chromatireducens TaxID=1386088 RepID=UPI0012DF28F6
MSPERQFLVRLVAPSNSAHTRLWAEAFLLQGHRPEVVSLSRGQALGFLGKLFTGVVASLFHRGPAVTVVHSLGKHALASLVLPRGRRHVVVPWGSEVVAAQSGGLRAWVARRALMRADLVLVTSQSMADMLAESWPVTRDVTRVISWGVDDLFLDEPGSSSASSTGSLRRRLGVGDGELLVVAPRGTGATYRSDEVRKAFMVARARRANLRLVVLGADTAVMKASEGEVLLPYLPKRELAQLFADADVVVSIPRWDQRSTTVLQAAASGTRLLLSDIGAYREIVALGIEATLLADPIVPALTTALVEAVPLADESVGHNRAVIRQHENQQRQMERVVHMCITRS